MAYKNIPVSLNDLRTGSVNYATRVAEDVAGIAVVTNGQVLPSGLLVSTTGAATLLTDTSTEVGYQQLSTGASATGTAAISDSATGLCRFLTDAAEEYFSTKIAIPTLSDGTQKYKGFFGWNDTPTNTTFTHAVGVWVDQTTPVANFMVAIGDGSVTPVATGLATVAVTAGQIYHIEIYSAPGSGVYSVYIDSNIVHSTSTGIPKTTALGISSGIKKNAGTTGTPFNIDWVYSVINTPARNPSFLA